MQKNASAARPRYQPQPSSFSSSSRQYRRSSVSPLRRQAGVASHYSSDARPYHPTSTYVTPPAQQRPSVRQRLGDHSRNGDAGVPAGFFAPSLLAMGSPNGQEGGSWARSRSSSRSRFRSNNNDDDDDDDDVVGTPTTPRASSTRRRLLKGFRRSGSVASFWGLDTDNSNNNKDETAPPVSPTKRSPKKTLPMSPPSPSPSSSVSPSFQRSNSSNTYSSDHRTKAERIKKHHVMQMTKRLHQEHTKRYPHAQALSVLEFIRTLCPAEVALKILAFMGPQIILRLIRSQRNIHHLLQYDVSWRVLCEELYKWKPGDPKPESWKEHYRMNPCVPVDYSSIGLAVAMAGAGWTLRQYKRYSSHTTTSHGAAAFSPACPEIQKDITIWIRPDAPQLMSHAISISTLRRTTTVTIRTMHTTTATTTTTVRHEAPRNTFLALKVVCPEDEGETENEEDRAYSSYDAQEGAGVNKHITAFASSSVRLRSRALLKSKTRRRNEPIFRVSRGQLVLQDLNLDHSCLGVDIWNGNAAIHIQPAYLPSGGMNNMIIPSATATVKQSLIRSGSGRGVVAVDGGHFVCEDSCIRECAATGLYIGGRGSCASLVRSDVWSNGMGSIMSTGGIARGHSGIYVEQAKNVHLASCAVAYNTASGISLVGSLLAPQILAINNQNWERTMDGSGMMLDMSNTLVLSNGCNPIDVPQGDLMVGDVPGQPPRFPWQDPARKNQVAVVGVPQAQSIPLQEEFMRRSKKSVSKT